MNVGITVMTMRIQNEMISGQWQMILDLPINTNLMDDVQIMGDNPLHTAIFLQKLEKILSVRWR